MELEEGIAMNDALTENVFVLVICILNRIPIFVVGKPGSSKTLAIQVGDRPCDIRRGGRGVPCNCRVIPCNIRRKTSLVILEGREASPL